MIGRRRPPSVLSPSPAGYPAPRIELQTLGVLDLRDRDGRTVQAVLAQPKRMALLLYLALAQPAGFHRRDILLALFWPEFDDERARAALRRALHHLRSSLGADAEVIVSRGDDELGIAGGAVRCDAVVFERAMDEGRPADAMALYRGDLLPGFFLADAPAFERWLDERRGALRRRAAEAAWALSDAEEAAGRRGAALEQGARATTLAMHDEPSVRRLIELHVRVGDPAGAVRTYEEYRRRLDEEFGVAPGAELVRLVTELRTGTSDPNPPARPTGTVIAAAIPTHSLSHHTVPSPEHSRLPRWLPLRAVPAALIVVAAAGTASVVAARNRSAAVPPRVFAVGTIRDFTGGGAAPATGALPDLLATSLARVPGLHVVSPARLRELAGDRRSPGAVVAAARRSGATALIEGALYRLPGGAFRMDLRQVELRSGSIAGACRGEATDPFAAVDSAAATMVRGVCEPVEQLAGVTTRSLVAYRFYQEGLRAYYDRGDGQLAARMFDAALREDSAFAMAAYYRAMADYGNYPVLTAYLTRATRLAVHATDHERLLIRGTWADLMDEPAGRAIAESLAARYPADADGYLLLGRARMQAGEFGDAVPALRRVLELESGQSHEGGGIRCRACEARRMLVNTYALQDSMDAAEREARAWLGWQPHSPEPVRVLGDVLEFRGRFAEALALHDRVRRLAQGDRTYDLHRAVLAMRSGDFARADDLLRRAAADGAPEVRPDALWFLAISLRNQGRLAEALRVVLELRRSAGNRADPMPLGDGALAEGIVLFEMGRARSAAALFDSLAARDVEPRSAARSARQKAWVLTHRAVALVAAGDTATALRLADRIRMYGERSAYGRDRRLDHHVRGLVYRAAGRTREAETEFRRAIFSPTQGYTRTNLELAKLLLEARRARDAIPLLRAALHGPVEASNLYVTHAELHALLGRAFAMAGEADSARVHEGWAQRAWKNADAGFHPGVVGVRAAASGRR